MTPLQTFLDPFDLHAKSFIAGALWCALVSCAWLAILLIFQSKKT